MKTFLTVAFLALLLLTGCGGGGASFTSGSPMVTLSATTLGFGTELVGGTSQTLPVTVTNSGDAALRITTITASANFGETDDCSLPLAAKTSCTITATFQPTASGNLSGTITIADNATGSPQTVLLTGTGTLSGPSCSSKGQECPAQFPPCCPGLTCTPASTRAFCE